MNRRQIILASGMAALAPSVHANPAPASSAAPMVELWPDGAPGGEAVKVREEIVDRLPEGPMRDRFVQHVRWPAITLFEPRTAFNGITLLIVPGGGYVRVVIDKEGTEAADWFAARGFAAAVLRYRLPADGWAAGADAPVHDAMRAVRMLRRGVVPDATPPTRVGVIGFSAGGHVCARLITEPNLSYVRVDAADDLSSRPDFAALLYPVISTVGASAHAGSAQQLVSSGVSRTDLARYSPHLNVDSRTPPTLLVHSTDDASVPVENSLQMYQALRAARVPGELHVFESGGHGFGLRGVDGKSVAIWPALVQNWAMRDVRPSS